MENKVKVFKIPLKAFLNEISPKLGITSAMYEVFKIKENTFSASVHIKGIIEHETVT